MGRVTCKVSSRETLPMTTAVALVISRRRADESTPVGTHLHICDAFQRGVGIGELRDQATNYNSKKICRRYPRK
jgi:hypothetical protein